jgi:hypothetical protein
VKECIVIETMETKNARGQGRKRKSVAIDADDEEVEASEGVTEKPTNNKGKGKDDHDVNKLLGMIERCGVVITEVQSSK